MSNDQSPGCWYINAIIDGISHSALDAVPATMPLNYSLRPATITSCTTASGVSTLYVVRANAMDKTQLTDSMGMLMRSHALAGARRVRLYRSSACANLAGCSSGRSMLLRFGSLPNVRLRQLQTICLLLTFRQPFSVINRSSIRGHAGRNPESACRRVRTTLHLTL